MAEGADPQAQCYLVVAVLDREDRLDAVLRALARRGHGATFINSLGMGRLRKEVRATDIPLIATLSRLLDAPHPLNVTLFSVVQGENAVWDVIGAIEGEVGDLNKPHAGLAFALPLSHLTGYIRYDPHELPS